MMKKKAFIVGLVVSSLVGLFLLNAYAVNIDGNVDEWINVPVFIADAIGDIDIYRDTVDGSRTDNGKMKITGRSYQYDVKEIKMVNDSNNLYILIELADDLDYYFQKNKEYSFMGGNIGEFYIDTDNNKSTGEKAPFIGFTGFEKELSIVVSTTMDSYKYSISYWLDLLPFDFNKRLTKNSDSDKDYITTANNFIEMRIPLSAIGISSEQSIRVIFKESGAKGLTTERFSEEVVKIIK